MPLVWPVAWNPQVGEETGCNLLEHWGGCFTARFHRLWAIHFDQNHHLRVAGRPCTVLRRCSAASCSLSSLWLEREACPRSGLGLGPRLPAPSARRLLVGCLAVGCWLLAVAAVGCWLVLCTRAELRSAGGWGLLRCPRPPWTAPRATWSGNAPIPAAGE